MSDSAEEQISNVWLSTESHLRNTWRFLNFSDSGSLTLSENGILFYSKNGIHRKIEKIDELDLTYADFPWGSLILAIVICSIFLGGTFYFDDIQSAERLIVLFLIIMPISIIMQKATIWIKITYQDKLPNTREVVYIADGSRFGRGGVFGGTLSLYKRIRTFYSKKAG